MSALGRKRAAPGAAGGTAILMVGEFLQATTATECNSALTAALLADDGPLAGLPLVRQPTDWPGRAPALQGS